MRKPTYSASKFPLGRVVATPGAYDALTPIDIKRGIFFHSQGDWGDVCEEDKRLNDAALLNGLRGNEIIAKMRERFSDFVENGGGHARAAALRIREGYENAAVEEIIKIVGEY